MDLFSASAAFFPTPIQQFQFFDKYSRFNYDLMRRETWIETVDRAVDYLRELSNNRLPESDYKRIRDGILNMRVMPSMRLLAMAGQAARRQNISIYNCSYMPVDSLDSFIEALIISMSGCGVGFSVERHNVAKFPVVEEVKNVTKKFTVPDTTDGWADALRVGLETWFSGEDVVYDYSWVRPAGAPLKIKGGQASGPEPLREMLDFTRRVIQSRAGGKLTTLDCHDIMCMIGKAAVSGGVRRTAMISLFSVDDHLMLNCKNGEALDLNPHRWNANNSVVIDRDLTYPQFRALWDVMIKSERGEPGIFNRKNCRATKPARRANAEFGTNPCGEIVLRPFQFCNLSMAIAREGDTLDDLRDKVEVATIIGTIQSMATSFPGLRKVWSDNCEEERLLGVDITGQMDCEILREGSNVDKAALLGGLRHVAVKTNKIYAEWLNIARSTAVTCVKPSGNSSQLLNSASGLHARWSPYYVRNIRVNRHSPLWYVMRESGAPMHPENGQTAEDANKWVIHFPVKAPEGARTDYSAIEQCEHWLVNKVAWTEHNPSVTITYKPEEISELTEWVWAHFAQIGGMAFLPKLDARYAQMPYEEITKDEYDVLISEFPTIDFSRIPAFETIDLTTASQELACVAGVCEVP